MNDLMFLQIQTAELRRLLDVSAEDPIVGPQLRDRLSEAQQELETAQRQAGTLLPREPVEMPRAAIFLRGGGVHGSEGVRPSLAGEALIQYEKMFIAQAVHDERIAAKTAGRQRRPRGAVTPGLMFTGTPRGSFGLEFVPRESPDEGEALRDVHARSLENVAEALARVAESGSFDEAVGSIPAPVLQPLKQFLELLAQNDAELRLAFQDRPSRSLRAPDIKIAADRLEREVKQETVKISGTFRGLTLESGRFDLLVDETLISGIVADELTEDDLLRIHKLTNQPCTAELQKTTVRKVGGAEAVNYVLLDAR